MSDHCRFFASTLVVVFVGTLLAILETMASFVGTFVDVLMYTVMNPFVSPFLGDFLGRISLSSALCCSHIGKLKAIGATATTNFLFLNGSSLRTTPQHCQGFLLLARGCQLLGHPHSALISLLLDLVLLAHIMKHDFATSCPSTCD